MPAELSTEWHGPHPAARRPRSHDGVKARGWGREGARGAGGEPIGGRRVPGAASGERGAESRELGAPGWGRGRTRAERRGSAAAPAPTPAASPPAAARARGRRPAMEPDNSPRKIQFTVPLLEPHLDPEAAEQVRSRAGRRVTCPAEDRGSLDCRIREPRWVLPWQCATEGERAQSGGLPFPPPRRSHMSLSVLLRDRRRKDERLHSKLVPARVAPCLPSPGGGGCLRTRPLPPPPLQPPPPSHPRRSFGAPRGSRRVLAAARAG